MKRLALFLGMIAATPLLAQPAPTDLTTPQAHQREMAILGLKSLRAPRNATQPSNPAYANYDEDVATRLSTPLADPLTNADGSKITTRAAWLKRKAELMALFERDVVGKRPAVLPRVSWKVTDTVRETVEGVAVISKKVTGHADNSFYPAGSVDIALQVTTPAASEGRAVPVIMVMGSLAPPPAGRGAGRGPVPGRGSQQVGTYPDYRAQILSRGWGYVIFDPASVQADNGAGFTRGIIGLVNKGRPRSINDWGTLSAWGWGISRAMDYLQADSQVDARRVGLYGHSRYGKAAVVTMMYEPRIAVGYISSSGKGGAAPYRRVYGSTVENMSTVSEFQWQNGRFMTYAADPLTAKDMPVDSNHALALIAPRALFVSTGKYMPDPSVAPGDGWVDGKGSFEAMVSANPVYRLMGRKGLDSTAYPGLMTLVDGDGLAFRQHDEGHVASPNWSYFLDFASKEFKLPVRAAAR